MTFSGSQRSKGRCKNGQRKSQPRGECHEDDTIIVCHDDEAST